LYFFLAESTIFFAVLKRSVNVYADELTAKNAFGIQSVASFVPRKLTTTFFKVGIEINLTI
jgi:hypothetical protein